MDNLPMSEDSYMELKKKLDFLLSENVRLQENNRRLKAKFSLIGLSAQCRGAGASLFLDAHEGRGAREGKDLDRVVWIG